MAVHEFERGGPGADFGAVDHDEVGRDAGLQHGLHGAEKFRAVADAKLESDGLSA